MSRDRTEQIELQDVVFLQSAAEELGPFSCGVEVSTELKFEAVDVRVHGLDSLGWCRLYGLECH